MTRFRPCLGLLLVFFFAFHAAPSPAQKKGSPLRTLHGSVFDKDGAAAPTAVVYLKNLRTQNVQSRITDEHGGYRFSGIDPNADYEVHAEKDSLKSATHTVSSLESRSDILVNLKLDRKRD